MKKYSYYLIVLMVLALGACQTAAKEQSLPEKVAEAYGFSALEGLKQVQYTWNVQAGERRISRTWTWNMAEQRVTYADADTTFQYALTETPLPEIDAAFVNDKYWALFPFQLMWDSGYTYEVEENAESPISGAVATKLIIRYNDSDGYTPGDAYDLYLDERFMIREWVFRKGNGAEGRAFTWEQEEQHAGITLSTMHRNAAGERFIWLTDIEVE
ncbi:MAG: hypothetical protein ACXIT9_13195 [Nitritalea sp.]